MTAAQVLPDQNRLVRPNMRWHTLRTFALIGAPMIGISLLLCKLRYIRTNGPVDGFFSVLYIAGFLCTAIALRRMRVTGRGKAGMLISGIQITGLAMAEIWALLTMVGSPAFVRVVLSVTDLSWPFSHLFMLVIGIAARRARVWKRWPLYMLFVCGCALPAAMGIQRVWGDLGTVLAFGSLTAVPLTVIALHIKPEPFPV